MFENIRADKMRYKDSGIWLLQTGFWVTFVYRFGSWTGRIRPKILQIPFRMVYALCIIPVHCFTNVYIPSRAQIGPGLLLKHPNLIFISKETVIGPECTIYHDVTFGHGSRPGGPELDTSVVVFPGARILGGIHIGENAHIGANTVVTQDIKPWTMVIAPKPSQLPMRMTKALLRKCSE
jgi:serine O-acetyltransferase